MYCLITEEGFPCKIEDPSYWLIGSYKMKRLDYYLKDIGRQMSIKYMSDDELVKEVSLGVTK